MLTSSGAPIPIAKRWFERFRIDDDITLLREPHVNRVIRSNIWHVRGRERNLLVDAGLGLVSLHEAAGDLFEDPLIVVATHTHFDHVGGIHEFDHVAVHEIESRSLAEAWDGMVLRASGFGFDVLQKMRRAGYEIHTDSLLDALPYEGFSPDSHTLKPKTPTLILNEGDVVDLGDRQFRVLHLPGHSPGSIGLFEPGTGALFSGDAIYDGPLLYELPGSDIGAYTATMERLLDLKVTAVHAGHDDSFGGARLREIARKYLDLWSSKKSEDRPSESPSRSDPEHR